MASDVVWQAVHTYLGTTWSGLPVHYENETFIRPALTATNAATPAAWLEVVVEGDTYDQRSIGSSGGAAERWVEEGALLATIFVQANVGSLYARQQLTTLANALRGLTLPNNIRFQSMAIGGGQPAIDDGAWWGLELRAHWIRG